MLLTRLDCSVILTSPLLGEWPSPILWCLASSPLNTHGWFIILFYDKISSKTWLLNLAVIHWQWISVDFIPAWFLPTMGYMCKAKWKLHSILHMLTKLTQLLYNVYTAISCGIRVIHTTSFTCSIMKYRNNILWFLNIITFWQILLLWKKMYRQIFSRKKKKQKKNPPLLTPFLFNLFFLFFFFLEAQNI